MSSTKKTDLYDRRTPLRSPEEPEDGPLCPMTRKRCLTVRCVIWDEERDQCALHPANLYVKMREAMTDAAVDLTGAYREGRT